MRDSPPSREVAENGRAPFISPFPMGSHHTHGPLVPPRAVRHPEGRFPSSAFLGRRTATHVTLVSGVSPASDRASGTRTYVEGLASRLRAKGVSVSLVAPDGGGLVAHDYLRIRTGPTSARFLARLVASASRLPIPPGSIIHTQRPDHLVAFAAAKRANPAVCTLHGIPAMAVRRRKGPAYGIAYAVLERLGLRRADRVIAVDSITAAWYRARYPRLTDRLLVIPTAVDTSLFHPTDRNEARRRFGVSSDYVLVYAGRLSPEKRVDRVIRALGNLPSAELLIAGHGPEEERLRAIANGRRVQFLGPVPHEDMPHVLNAADALVLPSEYEGMATVVLEALACGVPVVATPSGDLPRVVVPDRTGWLFEDPDALGILLSAVLPRTGDLRDACVAAAHPFGWDVVVERILSVYREVSS